MNPTRTLLTLALVGSVAVACGGSSETAGMKCGVGTHAEGDQCIANGGGIPSTGGVSGTGAKPGTGGAKPTGGTSGGGAAGAGGAGTGGTSAGGTSTGGGDPR